ncbi:hypothetical protein Zmor_005838 [Zophobas morio]|uniref:Uncharacterized protein n=1 Tax=Zophobas morio TaxID=2755281 RepID=A0AA38ITV0_9CUCU|nr:hypothetical protein Zmor_005838 [Zophobas morio]
MYQIGVVCASSSIVVQVPKRQQTLFSLTGSAARHWALSGGECHQRLKGEIALINNSNAVIVPGNWPLDEWSSAFEGADCWSDVVREEGGRLRTGISLSGSPLQ